MINDNSLSSVSWGLMSFLVPCCSLYILNTGNLLSDWAWGVIFYFTAILCDIIFAYNVNLDKYFGGDMNHLVSVIRFWIISALISNIKITKTNLGQSKAINIFLPMAFQFFYSDLSVSLKLKQSMFTRYNMIR